MRKTTAILLVLAMSLSTAAGVASAASLEDAPGEAEEAPGTTNVEATTAVKLPSGGDCLFWVHHKCGFRVPCVIEFHGKCVLP